jgi:glycosyltransferase involved in cell wall biosynthesis
MGHRVKVSVIIPTTASAARAQCLRQAISSVQAQVGVEADALVVVNGDRVESALVASIERLPAVRVLRLPEANLPDALLYGRENVDAAFFSQLDDDDELLPDALRVRLDALEADESVDVVVTRGLCASSDHEAESVASLDYARSDPLMAILERNWLYPGSALYRSKTIGPDYFRNVPKYLEWTFIGARLALERRIVFLDDVTFRYRTDNPDSISRTAAYVLAQPKGLKALFALNLPAPAVRRVRENLAAAHHACSVLHLAQSRHLSALMSHLKSLKSRSGLRYIAYTRHLIWAQGRPDKESNRHDGTHKDPVSGD